jgi:hypothetical protein
MTHDEFVCAYREGRVRVRLDRKAAARLVSRRLLLPLVLLPMLGLAVALALAGAWIWGAAIFIAALAFRAAVRASGPGFVLSRSLDDPAFYRDALAAGVLVLE